MGAEKSCRQCSICLQRQHGWSGAARTEARATRSAAMIRNAAGTSNPNEKFLGDGSEESRIKFVAFSSKLV